LWYENPPLYVQKKIIISTLFLYRRCSGIQSVRVGSTIAGWCGVSGLS
jgi:hypothetical protein